MRGSDPRRDGGRRAGAEPRLDRRPARRRARHHRAPVGSVGPCRARDGSAVRAADAEDVLQTVFLRLIKGGESYDFANHPEAYLSRAAINASLDLLRSRNRSRAVGLDEVNVAGIESKLRNPEAQHADRELQLLIRQAVARLGETAGEMFVLRYYEGYDNQEIAKLLGTSQMVVGVVLHRARTKLRKEIGHYLEKHHE